MIQSVIQSVKVERTPVPLVEDYSSQLRVAMDNGLVLQGIPVGVDANARYGENVLLSFIFDFGTYVGLMPVHEVGVPVYPIYKGGGIFTDDSVWSFLALSKKEKRMVESRMSRIMQAGCPLSFKVISIDEGSSERVPRVLLSRRQALEDIAKKTKLSVGQEITVNVILPTSFGAWCEYQGLNIYIPRHEVYYGDVSPAELLKPGYAYNVKIVEIGDMIRASTKALVPDPWERFECSPGSIRRAQIKDELKTGKNRFRVIFAPGITGVAQGAPLSTYHLDQYVNVRIIKVNSQKRFILGRIEE